MTKEFSSFHKRRREDTLATCLYPFQDSLNTLFLSPLSWPLFRIDIWLMDWPPQSWYLVCCVMFIHSHHERYYVNVIEWESVKICQLSKLFDQLLFKVLKARRYIDPALTPMPINDHSIFLFLSTTPSVDISHPRHVTIFSSSTKSSPPSSISSSIHDSCASLKTRDYQSHLSTTV